MKAHVLLALLASLLIIPAKAQWTYYNSYEKPIDGINCHGIIYGLYESGNVLTYDTGTTEVRHLDKTTGLSDMGVQMMDYSTRYGVLVLVYSNGNIDLVDTYSGAVKNMPQYKNSILAEYKLYQIWVRGSEGLITTKGGILRLNIKDACIMGFYATGDTYSARVEGDSIYALKADGAVLRGALKDNLLDPATWEVDPNRTFLPGYGRDKKACIPTLQNEVGVSGPAQTFCYKLRHNGRYLTSIGGRVDGLSQTHFPACVMYYDGDRWTRASTDYSADPNPLSDLWRYRDATDAIEDPLDPEHTFISFYGIGLMEYRSGKMVNRYGIYNSPLTTCVPGSDAYNRVSALAYDRDNTLWMVNDGADTLLVSRTQDGKWKKHYFSALKNADEVTHIIFDSNGYLWLADCRYAGVHKGQLFCYDPATGRSRARHDFTNEDGTAVNITECYTVVEDHNGQIWFGTNAGVLVVENPEDWFSDDFLVTQIKVPRNDGTNYADYLLSGVFITSIAVDGANRKWIGTSDSGIYLVSEDGTEILYHFDSTNSPLLDDCINDIAIDGVTGEVFFSSYSGLISYKGDATDPTEGLDSHQISIYPNPLRPENPRQIHITGLTDNAEVKICSLGGQVVASGHALGGAFHWDACAQNGSPCGSGVYIILVSTADGKHAIAGKLAIVR